MRNHSFAAALAVAVAAAVCASFSAAPARAGEVGKKAKPLAADALRAKLPGSIGGWKFEHEPPRMDPDIQKPLLDMPSASGHYVNGKKRAKLSIIDTASAGLAADSDGLQPLVNAETPDGLLSVTKHGTRMVTERLGNENKATVEVTLKNGVLVLVEGANEDMPELKKLFDGIDLDAIEKLKR